MNTFSGPDEEPLFDLDDELVVMAKDLGEKSPAKSVIKPKFVQDVRLKFVYMQKEIKT